MNQATVTPVKVIGASGERNNSASLRRALAILLELGEDAGSRGYTVTDLCARLDMNKSTLLRLLAPLIEARLVEQGSTGRYRLGWRNAQLGQSYLEGLDLRTSMQDVLFGLTEQTSETTHLVIADFPEVVYVDKVDSPLPVRMFSRVGAHNPAYCTSVGKAMLAYADDETIAGVIAGGMPERTANTLTTGAALRDNLETVRHRGYAIDDIENEEGIRCVAAPVFDHNGKAVAAVSISGPVSRVTKAKVAELGKLAIEAADEISRRLGARR